MQQKFQTFKKNKKTAHEKHGFSGDDCPFMDIEDTEFKRTYLTLKSSDIKKSDVTYLNVQMGVQYPSYYWPWPYYYVRPTPTPTPAPSSTTVPDSWDWRTQGAVTAIKNQGSCGDCWAFATIGNLEGLYYNKYKTLKTFAEQQLLDYDSYDQGCNGGMMDNAYKYLIGAGGIVLSSSYPYTGVKGSCRFSSANAIAKLSSWVSAGTTDETYIKKMLYQVGPLPAILNAGPLQYYTGGILNPTPSTCPNTPDHGVLLVGYGTQNETDYWIVKNSWGRPLEPAGENKVSLELREVQVHVA